ncbi:hypothetical protein GCM10027416_11430 [Okibacterium endophyticum]
MPETAVPPESAALKAAHRRSGYSMAELAAAIGMSRGSVQVALDGVRYRDGEAIPVVPPDATLVRLAGLLGIGPATLRELGRDRAAQLLEEADPPVPVEKPVSLSERESQAAVAARAAVVRQMLSIFSTEELRAELDRRDRAEHDEINREGIRDAAEEWRMTR